MGSGNTMSRKSEQLAQELESYGSSRADYRDASDEQREAVAKELVVARSQVENDAPHTRDGRYGEILIGVRARFYYHCGKVGIALEEANYLWHNYVYENVDYAKHRGDLV